MQELLNEMEEAIRNEKDNTKKQEIFEQYIFNASLSHRKGNYTDRYVDNIVSMYEKTNVDSVPDLKIFVSSIFSEDAVLKEERKEIANKYLASTDWVEPYLIKHYMGIELLPPESNKFIIEQKRKEARDAINAQS